MKKFLLILLIAATASSAFSQGKRKTLKLNGGQKPKNTFLEKQFWLGFKGGTNLSQADPIKRYSVLSATNYPASDLNKTYSSFHDLGSQATVEITFQFRNLSISTQPTFNHSVITYSNQVVWVNTQAPSQSLTQKYSQSQGLDFVNLPLIAKYDLVGNRLRGYVHGGIYYSFLTNALKTVTISGVDLASGGTNTLSSQPLIVGTKDLFTNYWGLTGGIGGSYQMGNVKLTLDVTYMHGMANITNVKNRFSNDRLAGIGDAQDDIKLNNIVISAGVLFPMRFLSSSFKSLDQK
ncbi:MAG: outer membrane beta-barrel protein [Bacteroidetes bacterium]|nr:outer membrane beta-barrel protein [Bacteroidota bacterium]